MKPTFEKEPLINFINGHKLKDKLLLSFDCERGEVTYNPQSVNIPPNTPDFRGSTTTLNNEEYVRIVFLLVLASDYGYPLNSTYIDIEKVYEAPGRPKKGVKGARADIIIRDENGNPFLFFELKTPRAYDEEKANIKTQLFQASKLDRCRPKYLIWGTTHTNNSKLSLKLMVIPTDEFPEYDDWKACGEVSGNLIPKNYGNTIKKRYANVSTETDRFLPLDTSSDDYFFSALCEKIHDVIWDGGGTTNNEVFAIITKLFLCKIYDEKETFPNSEFEFQINYVGNKKESAEQLLDRMNKLYKKAEHSYLGITSSRNDAFDIARLKPSKIAFVIHELEGLSLTNNEYDKDLLGKFFEEIVSHGFTQTKGQFFTPVPIVEFMLDLCSAERQAKEILKNQADGRGIHQLPYVIDSSCGVGTFLIMYMKKVTAALLEPDFRKELNARSIEALEMLLAGTQHTSWAKNSLYAVENNYELGLAAKVNMILHGDGSMNTYVMSGLLPFSEYKIDNRFTVLNITQKNNPKMNERFDLVLSNPPFSIKLTDADKDQASQAFTGIIGQSENLFIERWYQLLKPGTGEFCCILPESIFDTDTQIRTRLFLISHFKIDAVISLPYLTFQPFTSVKTCVILAKKRTSEQTQMLEKIVSGMNKKNLPQICKALLEAGIGNETIFLAEPQEVGYKRRKGLSDIVKENDLPKVLDCFNDTKKDASLRYGFRTSIKNILSRNSVRLDPKYRWLWDILNGHINISNEQNYFRLDKYVKIVHLHKLKKGNLELSRKLIDLDNVYGKCNGLIEDSIYEVDEIGSDKVVFGGADILISKLEPYLSKSIIKPDPDAIGTTEWVGFKCRDVDPKVIGYLLSLPAMREAMRMLQSGKRHARLNPEELIELKFNKAIDSIDITEISSAEVKIDEAKKQMEVYRNIIDDLFK